MLREGKANRKEFIKLGEGCHSAKLWASSPWFALTHPRPRVSYLLRHSFGARQECVRRDRCVLVIWASKGRLCRTGSRRQLGRKLGVGAGREVEFPVSVRRTLLPAPGPEPIGGPDQSGCSRRQNISRLPADGRIGLCPAQSGEGGQETSVGMSVAASLGFLVFMQATGGGGGLTMLPILLIIPIMYFLMIRPQQKKQKQWQAMLASIKTGDRVTTAGGIRGIILSIKDDAIVIKVAPDGIKMEVAKNAIAAVTTDSE